MQAASVRRVSFYWSWIGGLYSSPSHRVVHLINCNGHYLRQDSASDEPTPIDIHLIAEFVATLRSPPTPTLDLDRIGLSASWLLDRAPGVIEQRCGEVSAEQSVWLTHEGLTLLKARSDLEPLLRKAADNDFNSCWTNDYPRLRVKVVNDFGNVVLVDSTSQHAFMLPWTIHDVAAGTRVEAYNADLSRAAARLLPDDFQGRFRLDGGSLVSSVLWEVLGDRMEEPHLTAEEKRDPPAFVPACRREDCSLLEAARTGQAARIEALVSAGADVEARDEEGRTPLILAVQGGHREAVAALLAVGADVEGRDNDGDTPLLHALPQSASMRALLSVLDKEEERDNRDHVGLVHMLLEAAADPNGTNSKYGTMPLLKVSQMKRPEALDAAQLLIEAGASVNVADDVGQTALMHAAFPPFDGEMFRLLARSGADTEARRNDGCTGLISAAGGGEAQAARAWIEAGAGVNTPGPNGNTPLMLACQGWPEIVETLLAAGADVNAADADGDTALHFAVLGYRWSTTQDKAAMVRRLLAAGANVRARNRKGHTALTELLRVEREQHIEEEVLREFQSNAQTCEPDITTAVKGDSELCRLLRDAGQ